MHVHIMQKMLLLTVFLAASVIAQAQLYMTRTGTISFFSKTALEDIQAENNQVYAVIDAGKKNLAFTLLMKGFIFRKELMQEHFNENYVESDKYPKANFTGMFTGDFTPAKDGLYHVIVKGSLTIHNTTRRIEQPATFELIKGRISGRADFKVRPEDYNISIPSIVRDKISGELTVHVRVDCNITR